VNQEELEEELGRLLACPGCTFYKIVAALYEEEFPNRLVLKDFAKQVNRLVRLVEPFSQRGQSLRLLRRLRNLLQHSCDIHYEHLHQAPKAMGVLISWSRSKIQSFSDKLSDTRVQKMISDLRAVVTESKKGNIVDVASPNEDFSDDDQLILSPLGMDECPNDFGTQGQAKLSSLCNQPSENTTCVYPPSQTSSLSNLRTPHLASQTTTFSIPPENTLKQYRDEGFKEHLKGCRVRVLDGTKYCGVEGTFLSWSGTVCYVGLDAYGKTALSVNRKVQVVFPE